MDAFGHYVKIYEWSFEEDRFIVRDAVISRVPIKIIIRCRVGNWNIDCYTMFDKNWECSGKIKIVVDKNKHIFQNHVLNSKDIMRR